MADNQAQDDRFHPLRRFRRALTHAFAMLFEADASLRAAGVAFYGFLAIFPALAAGVALFSLFVSPLTIIEGVDRIAPALPGELRDMVSMRLTSLLYGPKAAGIGLAVSVALALWSASRGVDSLIQALTLTHGLRPRRGFIHSLLRALAFTLGAFLLVAVLLAALAILPLAVALLPHGAELQGLLDRFSWPALAALNFAAHVILFRYGPETRSERVQPVWPGAAVATVLWMAGSAALTFYFHTIARYDALFGSLAGVAIVMFWLYMMTLFTLFGARVNARM
ncbi:MAG: YihY/virulence factor BrkB family protein [Rhizobiaceae bacterium]|jgi:membrane protein|nr:YihY/virulence factor BrkB family protein [Rhizobiaceae bacterium]